MLDIHSLSSQGEHSQSPSSNRGGVDCCIVSFVNLAWLTLSLSLVYLCLASFNYMYLMSSLNYLGLAFFYISPALFTYP